MGMFTVRHCRLVCARCGSQIGRAAYRTLPGRLDVMGTAGQPRAPERAGRVLQRLDDGLLHAPSDDLRRWLERNVVEVVYEFDCPEHGQVWATTGDIAAAIRATAPDTEWVRLPTVG